MIFKRVVVHILVAPILLLALTAHASNAPSAQEKQKEKSFEEITYDWTRTFAEVLQLTHEKHYKVNNLEECMIKAVDGFLNCLDPHSNFLDPKTYKLVIESTSGEFFGIGIVMDGTRSPKDGLLTIIDTIPSGPSDKAGIKPLDKIIEIDGEPLKGMSTEEIMAKLKGERNTKVEIKIVREGQQDLLTFEVTRDVVKEQTSLSFYLEDQNVYYVSLSTFGQSSMSNIEKLIKKAKEKRYKGLILDLRNNTGGLLTSVLDIAGLFLDKESVVVSTKTKNGRPAEEYRTSHEPAANTDLPIFILINNYTASCAEILAGCLKLHSDKLSEQAGKKGQKKLMVFLVGTTTFGKGSVQEVIPISNNCAVKITYSLYFLPGDISIQGQGITPDFEVDRTLPPTEQIQWFKKNYGQEKALHNYIKNEQDAEQDSTDAAKKKKDAADDEKKNNSWTERAKKALEEDNQFREALTLINILHMGQTCAPQEVNTRKKAIEFMNKIHVTNKKLNLIPVE